MSTSFHGYSTTSGLTRTFISLKVSLFLGVLPFNESRLSRAAKRGLDILVSSAAFLLSSPLLAMIAVGLGVRDSRGPVFYRHERVGKGGHAIRLFKFRTMYLNACRGADYGGEEDSVSLTPS